MKTDLCDWERLLLFYYLLNKGLPPWAGGCEDVAIWALLDWPQNRIDAARKVILKKGMLGKTPRHLR